MFHVRGVFRNFFKERAPNFITFSSVVFSPAKLILSNLSNKNDSRGSGGMLPRKIFENLHTVMVILTLLEQFSGKICLYFRPLTLSASSNMMHFVSAVSIMRA